MDEPFSEIMETFAVASERQLRAGRRLAELKPQLADVRRQMDEIEAEILNNGGYDTVAINGKNAETRDGQLKIACGKHPAFVALRAARADLERDIDHCQNDERDADNIMKRCRLAAEQHTAETYREAARMPLREMPR